MGNTEKKLDALIDALGFDVEEIVSCKALYKNKDIDSSGNPDEGAAPSVVFENIDYKITKRNDHQRQYNI